MKIAVDFGHVPGGDPGAVANGLIESDLTGDIGERIVPLLVALGHDVKVMPRGSLQARTDAANKEDADLFLSVHVNAFGTASVHGVEVHHYPGDEQGRAWAEKVDLELAHLFRVDRGVKASNFHVLRESKMPAILVECGFITNQDDAAYLSRPESRQAIAAQIAAAIGPARPRAEQASAWAADAWSRAYAKKVFDGTRPGEPVTREMLAVVLDRIGLLK